jgi:hypothetical protein
MIEEIEWKRANHFITVNQMAMQKTALLGYGASLRNANGDTRVARLDASSFPVNSGDLPKLVKQATASTASLVGGRSEYARPMKLDPPKLQRTEDLKAFRVALSGFITNQFGERSHCLHLVGRPDPENKDVTFEYTRKQDADTVDRAIATVLTGALAYGPGKSFLDPKLMLAGKGHEIFSSLTKHFEGLAAASAATLWNDLSAVTTRDSEHYNVAFTEIEQICDDLDIAGQTASDAMKAGQIERTFKGHWLYGEKVRLSSGTGVSFDGWRSAFAHVRRQWVQAKHESANATAVLNRNMRGGGRGSGGYRPQRPQAPRGDPRGDAPRSGANANSRGANGRGASANGRGGGFRGAGGRGGGNRGAGGHGGRGSGGGGGGRANSAAAAAYLAGHVEAAPTGAIGNPLELPAHNVVPGSEVEGHLAEEYDAESYGDESYLASEEYDQQDQWQDEYGNERGYMCTAENASVNLTSEGAFKSVDIVRADKLVCVDDDAELSVKKDSVTDAILIITQDRGAGEESAFAAAEDGSSKGVLDTGCTTTLTPHRDQLRNIRECKIKILLGNSSSVLATERGEIPMRIPDTGGAYHEIMHPAIYVKPCPTTLLSVDSLTQQGYTFHFGRSRACMMEEKFCPSVPPKVIALQRNGKLWELDYELQGVNSKGTDASPQ